MKFLVCIAALVAVAFASPVARTGQVEAIIAAINSPSTDPATAALLQEQLAAIVADASLINPIAVGPALVEEPSLIDVEPVYIELPAPAHDDGAITADEPAIVNPTPAVVIGDLPAGSAAPIVQIIVKVNKPEAVVTPVAVGGETITPGAVNWVDNSAETPVVTPVQVTEPVAPGAVNWVDGAENVVVSPVQVAEPVVPGAVNWVDGAENVVISPVQVAEPVVPGAVNWVDGAENVVVEPIAIGAPIVPIPVVAQPEPLN